MTPETTKIVVQLVIASGVVGGLIATYASHRLSRRRERESGREKRKREFRSFIVRLKSDAIEPRTIGHLDRARSFAAFYREKKPELRTAVANVENDFPRKQRAKFDHLVNTAANFTDVEAYEPGGKNRVLESLDAILNFLDESA